MNKPILIYGGGSLCRVIESMLRDMNYNEIYIFDSNIKELKYETKSIFSNKNKDLKQFIQASGDFVVAIGNEFGFARCKISNLLINEHNLKPVNVISSDSYIDRTSKIGEGNIVMPGVRVNKFVNIGNFNILGLGALVEHESQITNGIHLMGSSLINGRVYIQDYSTIGSGSVIFPDITISENSFVGACSMVNRDTEANSIVTGTPAKFLRANKRIVDLEPFSDES